jgi:hypothetical protein
VRHRQSADDDLVAVHVDDDAPAGAVIAPAVDDVRRLTAVT